MSRASARLTPSRRTPAVAYALLPKTGPTGTGGAGTPVVLLINDLDIRVINTTTGDHLRHLTLDPTRGYQPRQK